MADGEILRDEIISQEAINSPLELQKNLKKVYAEIDRLIKAFKSLNISVKNIQTVTQLAKAQNSLSSSTKQLTLAEKEHIKLQKQIQSLQAKLIAQQSVEAQSVAQLKNRYAEKNKQLRETAKNQQGLNSSSRNQIGIFGGLISQIKNVALAYFSLQSVMNIVRSAFATTLELDKLKFSFNTIIEDSTELSQTQAYLTTMAMRYGQEIIKLSESYIRLRATLKTTNITFLESQEIFESIVKAGSVLGLSTQRIELALLAIEQMASKGTVSMEELRRQLGDNIPGAVGIMAKALGVTIPKLYDMIKANEVLASEALPKFAKELEKTYGIESLKSINTLNAAVNNFKNTWILFIESLGASDVLSHFIKSFTEFFYYFAPAIKMTEILRQAINNAGEAVKKLDDELSNARKNQLDQNKEVIKGYKNQIEIMSKFPSMIGDEAKKYDDLNNKINELEQSNKELNIEKSGIKEYLEGLAKEINMTEEIIEQLSKKEKKNKLQLSYYRTYLALLQQLREEKLYEESDEAAKGYLNTLRDQMNVLEEKREKEKMSSKYWENIDDINAKILEKQKEIDKILGKQKAYYDGIIPKLEEQLSLKEELLKKAKDETVIESINKEIEKLDVLIKYYKNLGKEVDNLKDYYKALDEATARDDAEISRLLKIEQDYQDARLEDFEKAKKEQLDKEDDYNDFLLDALDKFGFSYNEKFKKDQETLKALLAERLISEKDYNIRSFQSWLDHNQQKIELIEQFAQNVLSIFSELNQGQIDLLEEEIDKREENLDRLEGLLDAEEKLKLEGKNNNVARLKGQIAEETALRDKAAKELEKSQKRQAGIELASQASSIITATASIIGGWTKLNPLWGWIIGLSQAAAMIASFASYKAKIKSASKYAEGEIDIQGDAKPHSRGGKVVEIERHESIISADNTKKSKNLLTLIQEGKVTDKDLGLTGGINLNDKLKMSFMGGIPIVHVNQRNEKLESEIRELRKSNDKMLDFFENSFINTIYNPKTGAVIRKKRNRIGEYDNINSAYGF